MISIHKTFIGNVIRFYKYLVVNIYQYLVSFALVASKFSE